MLTSVAGREDIISPGHFTGQPSPAALIPPGIEAFCPMFIIL